MIWYIMFAVVAISVAITIFQVPKDDKLSVIISLITILLVGSWILFLMQARIGKTTMLKDEFPVSFTIENGNIKQYKPDNNIFYIINNERDKNELTIVDYKVDIQYSSEFDENKLCVYSTTSKPGILFPFDVFKWETISYKLEIKIKFDQELEKDGDTVLRRL